MANGREHLMQWLRDAHAMEQQAEHLLRAQVERIESYPKLKARLEQHIRETLDQQESLEICIKHLGGVPSIANDAVGRATAFGQAIGGGIKGSELVDGAAAGYVFEHMEIAAYTALVAAAASIGEAEAQRTCEKILVQERSMADWLSGHLYEVARAFVVRPETSEMKADR
jgi:ferritin-like metal-binding protein YciE